MDNSDYWLDENPSIPLSPSTTEQVLENLIDYPATNILASCETWQEFPKMEFQIPVDSTSFDLTYSDTDSDGVEVKIDSPEIPSIPIDPPYNLSNSSITDSGFSDYPGPLPSLLLKLSNSPSATHSDYYYSQEELNGSKLRVCREGNDSVSLLGRPRCEICHINHCNTCLMHHQSRHTDLCYTCASSLFAKSHMCPLCSDRIVYIYMYDDL